MAGLVALGFSLSILAFILVVGFERDRHQHEFESKAASRVAALQSEVISHIDVVHSLQSLYSATESVSRSDFGGSLQLQLLVLLSRASSEDRVQFVAP